MFGGTLEVPMSILLAKCPQCRTEVDTGISADGRIPKVRPDQLRISGLLATSASC